MRISDWSSDVCSSDLVARLRRTYPDQWRALLEAADVPGPMALRVNTRLTSVQAVQGALEAAGIAAVPTGGPGLVLLTPRPVQAVPGFEEGWWSVQDLAIGRASWRARVCQYG